MEALLHPALRPVEVGAPERPLPVAPAGPDPEAWREWFERLYREAEGDSSRIPWGDGEPSPALVAWMNREAPAMVRPGARVAVVGSGLGDDVRELADRGYDVTGFDISPAAVEWAKRLHPDIAERFAVADVMDLPSSLKRRADLVVEVSTIQAVHPSLREKVAGGIAALARPHGVVLAVCRGRDEDEPLPRDHPPYPLTCAELTTLFAREGFTAVRAVDDFEDDEAPPKRRLRAAFKRA